MTDLERLLRALPDTLGGHVLITVLPLAVAVAISVPAALYAVRHPRLRTPLLTVVGVVQTIPGLALLALMVPALVFVGTVVAPLGVEVPALGLLPALAALTLYSMLPVVRNTVTGIEEVDHALVEAATAMGMTRRQVLLQVQLPLAAPVILAGIRTAAVWVVGTATLATPVGQPSLGNYIFAGLQTRDTPSVLFGCVAAALLAIGLDACLAVVERGLRQRDRRRVTGALAVLAVACGAGLLAPVLARTGDDRPTVVVGSKTFTEQYILASVLERRLEAAGFAVERRDSLGSTVAFDGLAASEIDVYVDYTGTLWANQLQRADTQPGGVVLDELTRWLDTTLGVRLLGPLGFENAYALAMRVDHAASLGIADLDGLARHAPSLAMGSDYEFLQRPEWAAVEAAYGLRFDRQTPYDPSFMYEAVKRRDVDVISAFSSDGRIAAYGLVTLDDPRGALPPYDAVVLLAPRAPPGVAAALEPLIGAIGIDAMREANRAVDLDGRAPDEAAATLDPGD